MLRHLSISCLLLFTLVAGSPVKLGWAGVERQEQIASSAPGSASSSAPSSLYSPTPTTNVDPPFPQPTSSVSGALPTVTINPPSTGYQAVAIQGRRPTLTYETFLGIPFAQPPTGDLRYAPPLPATYNTNGTIDAGEFKPACAQGVYSGHQTFQDLQGEYGTSEDCLYLNVVRPVGLNESSALPALILLHGGNYYGGAASAYDGNIVGQIAGDMGTPFIQITIPYRLGVLGWAAALDLTSSGAANLGLQDAVLGLEWVRDNVAAFGGDPTKVTAAGQSSGGAIIALLYLRPQLNLFRAAILMSAPPSLFNLGPAASVDTTAWWEFVEDLNCSQTANTNSTTPVLDCLRSRSVNDTLRAQTEVITRRGPYSLFGPVIDGLTISASPYEILSTGGFRNAPIIIGGVKDEGTTFVLPNISTSEFQNLVRNESGANRSEEVAQRVMQLYTDDPADGSPFGSGNDTFVYSSEFKRAAAYYGDAHLHAPRRHFLESLSYFGVNNSWGYLFEQPMPESLGIPPYIGTGHHSDTIWSFGRVLTPLYNYTIEDQTLSLSMIRYFVNFISHSNPNPDPSLSNTTSPTTGTTIANQTTWPSYDGDQRNLLQLIGNDITPIKDDFRADAIEFFLENWMDWRY